MIRSYRGVLPRVHETALIDPSAQVVGDVGMGEESSVWMNVVGSPGKVRRALEPGELVSIAGYAERYVGYAREYRGL